MYCQQGLAIQASESNFQTLQGTLPLSPVYPPCALFPICLSPEYVPCTVLLVCFSPFHPLLFLFGYLLSTLLCHTGSTRPPDPHPVPCNSIITHAHTRWSRYHQARYHPLYHGPGSRSASDYYQLVKTRLAFLGQFLRRKHKYQDVRCIERKHPSKML